MEYQATDSAIAVVQGERQDQVFIVLFQSMELTASIVYMVSNSTRLGYAFYLQVANICALAGMPEGNCAYVSLVIKVKKNVFVQISGFRGLPTPILDITFEPGGGAGMQRQSRPG